MLERCAVAIASFLLCASDAFAGAQLFEGSWSVKAFGNERTGGTGESQFYSAFRLPLGVQCNPLQPRCPFQSTPTDGVGNFAPLGGSQMMALFCAPWADWQGMGTTARPAKGQTLTTGGIAILRLRFAPEPRAGLNLAAGIGMLAAGYRLRRSRRHESAPPH